MTPKGPMSTVCAHLARIYAHTSLHRSTINFWITNLNWLSPQLSNDVCRTMFELKLRFLKPKMLQNCISRWCTKITLIWPTRAKLLFSRDPPSRGLRRKLKYTFSRSFLFFLSLQGPINRIPQRKGQPKFDWDLLSFLKLHFALISVQKASQTAKRSHINKFSRFQQLFTFKETTESSAAVVNILKPSKESLGGQNWT